MKKAYLLTIALFTLSFHTSCEKIDLLDEEEGNVNTSTGDKITRSLSIVAKATTDASLTYPISIYAFDDKNECKASSVIQSSSTAQLSLPSGNYHITAVSLPSAYPSLSSSNASISMPSNGTATTPFMLGSANINLYSSNQTANIVLGYRQASVNISLADIPADVTGIKVSIGAAYTEMSLSGTLAASKVVTVDCSKSNGKWTSGTFYIMPTQGDQTVLTITLNKQSGQSTSYSYTYNSSLKAGTPYNFNGSYAATDNEESEITINTTISAGEWSTPVNDSFTFGPGASSDITPGTGGNAEGGSQEEGTPESSEDGIYYVSAYPKDGDIWNGHVVLFADDNEYRCLLTLISIKEWFDVYSSFNESNSGMAQQYATSYEEKGLSGWRIPTSDEAKVISATYSYEDNFNQLNSLLTQCGSEGSKIYKVLEGKNVRFLCENGSKTYSFANSTLSAAGASTKYHLRLVKTLTLKLK